MGALLGIVFLVVVGRFVYQQAMARSAAPSGRAASAPASRGVRNGVRRGSEWAAQRTAGKTATTTFQRVQNGARKWGDYEIRKADERAARPSKPKFRHIFRPPPVEAVNGPDDSNGHPQDELAPRRERRNAPRQDEPPANSPDSPAGAPPQDPETDGGEQPAMSHSSNGSGSGADLFSALQQVMSQARAGGLQAKHRAIKTFAEAEDYLSQVLQQFAQEMAEPDQGYPQSIWEPIQQASQHNRAAATKMAESDAAMTQLSNMQVGELAASPVKAPHHSELNSDTASR